MFDNMHLIVDYLNFLFFWRGGGGGRAPVGSGQFAVGFWFIVGG